MNETERIVKQMLAKCVTYDENVVVDRLALTDLCNAYIELLTTEPDERLCDLCEAELEAS